MRWAVRCGKCGEKVGDCECNFFNFKTEVIQ